MTDDLTFKKVCGSDNSDLDIIFVHGLTGDPKDTWAVKGEKGQEDVFWPEWLCEKFPNAAIYTLGYPATIFEKWAKKEMDIFERAENALEYMAAQNIGAKPVVFVCHSLGGLLVKQILRAAKDSKDDGWKNVAQRTCLITFLGTPHAGSSLASILKFMFPKLSSSHIETLTEDNGYLTNLNKFYRDFAPDVPIKTVVYYEKYKTKGVALLVDEKSADPGVHKTRAIGVDADHLDICKPKNKDAFVFTGLCRHLEGIYQDIKKKLAQGSDFDLNDDDYTNASESDRRDLLQKLIDANREHEYPYANDLQNKFAQRYYKLGLYSEAKSESDKILAEVEQRFNLHVYHPKICKAATHDDVATALQEHVIDPVCAAYADSRKISAKTVLRALYFLTEQCYIRWDAP